jgi:hypothetical protein
MDKTDHTNKSFILDNFAQLNLQVLCNFFETRLATGPAKWVVK